MIKCVVKEDKMGCLTVTFEDNTDIFLQSDYERSAFAVNCGFIIAPEDWDGCPSGLPSNWWDEDFESIEECPEEYNPGD